METHSIYLVVEQQLWTLEVPRSHTHIVLLIGVVELCQTPVNQSQLRRRKEERGMKGGYK